MKKLLFISLFIFIFYGCSRNIPTPTQRYQTAQILAEEDGLKSHVFHNSKFDIFAYKKTSTCKDTMSIYIEGDGFAWLTSSLLSSNPTPLNPLALKLMTKDSSTCKVYLARPCQYVQNSTCKKAYWSSGRFSNEIVQNYVKILDKLKNEYGVKDFRLYGYSGGGAIATLLSAKRDDISRLVSIAGNLDTKFWTTKHYLTLLYNSLNPADFSEKLSRVKQIHLIGAKDKIIDKSIYDSYLKNFKNRENISYKIFEEFNHRCCWYESWIDILKKL